MVRTSCDGEGQNQKWAVAETAALPPAGYGPRAARRWPFRLGRGWAHGGNLMMDATIQRNLNRGATLMAVAAAAFVAYAALFFALSFTGPNLELGITTNEVDKTGEEIEAFSPSLMDYVRHLHVAVSGFIAALGVAIIGLAWFGVRHGDMWAWSYAVGSAVLALAVALPLHYPYGFATTLHLGPIYVATVLFVAGALVSWRGFAAIQKEKHKPMALRAHPA